MQKQYVRESFEGYYTTFLGGKLFRWLDAMKVRIIQKVIWDKSSDLKVLDMGCGSASISGRLVDAFPGIEVVGVDHDEKLLEAAEGRGLRVQLANLDGPLPFDNDSFDVVLMIDTIEHIESRNQTLLEVKRLLNPRGTLVLFTPPYDSLTWLVGEWFFKIVTGRQSDHISPFTGESLSWLLSRNFSNWRIGRTNFGLTLYGIGEQKIP